METLLRIDTGKVAGNLDKLAGILDRGLGDLAEPFGPGEIVFRGVVSHSPSKTGGGMVKAYDEFEWRGTFGDRAGIRAFVQEKAKGYPEPFTMMLYLFGDSGFLGS
ncbi:hypothetical protein FUAX_40990 (plasmid) [Fulvitalea axinellae]|uniref:Uncharacterized protein n=1 Tax=Fulvitalea axinellae TaxID=1182444 RepID=A0AAU9CUJ6_9BACT|nr:hypothetical protein FUAX_40990 [Fulvitalea axinellae]